MNIYLRKVASEGINHHVEHCIFVPASRVLFSSRCPTFRVSLLSSIYYYDIYRESLTKLKDIHQPQPPFFHQEQAQVLYTTWYTMFGSITNPSLKNHSGFAGPSVFSRVK